MYLVPSDVSAADLDSYSMAAWAVKTTAQQQDFLQTIQTEINTRCHRSFDLADGAMTRQVWGTNRPELWLPEVPLVALQSVSVLYPGMTTYTALPITGYVVNPWERMIVFVDAIGTQVLYPILGWPDRYQFSVTYTYGIDFSTPQTQGSADPRAVRTYNDIRRAGLLLTMRRLHLQRTPSNVASIKRGDSQETYQMTHQNEPWDATTPTEADIERILQPHVWIGDPI